MNSQTFEQTLRKLSAIERFELLFGLQKPIADDKPRMKIPTLPLDCCNILPKRLPSFLVVDRAKNSCYLAILLYY